MENLISTCWVIESADLGVEPIIYLRQPLLNIFGQSQLISFPNPFFAKNFIRDILGQETKVSVSKEKVSQAHVLYLAK